MVDLIGPITTLSKFFQTENIDIALINVKIDQCISNPGKVKALESPTIQQSSSNMRDKGNFKGDHKVKWTGFNFKKLPRRLVISWSITFTRDFHQMTFYLRLRALAMRPLSLLSPKDQDEYGEKEIKTLCEHYGKAHTQQCKDDGETREKVCSPLFDAENQIRVVTRQKGLYRRAVSKRHNVATLVTHRQIPYRFFST